MDRTMQQKLHVTHPDGKLRSMAMVQAEAYMADLETKGILDYDSLREGWQSNVQGTVEHNTAESRATPRYSKCQHIAPCTTMPHASIADAPTTRMPFTTQQHGAKQSRAELQAAVQ